MPTMLDELQGGIHIVVHGSSGCDDDEWDEYLERLSQHVSEVRYVVVFTDGAGPSSAQRARLAAVAPGYSPPAVVISDSLAVRGMVTAIRWLGGEIRAFKTSELHAALEHAKLSPEERRNTISRAAALKARLHDAPTSSMSRPRTDAPVTDPEVMDRLNRVKARVDAIKRQQK